MKKNHSDRLKTVLYLNYGGIHDIAVRAIQPNFKVIEIGIDINKNFTLKIKDKKASSVVGSIYYFNKLKELIAKNNIFFDLIAIADLSHPLNNLLFSNFPSKEVILTYDGSVNIINFRMGFKNIIKDIFKKYYCLLNKKKYTCRYRYFNGIDIIKKRQIYQVKNLDFKVNITLDPPLKDYIQSLKNTIIYISIALDYFNVKEYIEHEKKSIQFLKKKYNKTVKILYRRDIPKDYINQKLSIDRSKFNGYSAEEIIYLINPKLIAGDVSSTLFNCSMAMNKLNVISIGLNSYYNNLEKVNPKPTIAALKKYNIKIFNY